MNSVTSVRMMPSMHDGTALSTAIGLLEHGAASVRMACGPRSLVARLIAALRDEPPPFATDHFQQLARSTALRAPHAAIVVLKAIEQDGIAARSDFHRACGGPSATDGDLYRARAIAISDGLRARLRLVDDSFGAIVDSGLRAMLDRLIVDPSGPHEPPAESEVNGDENPLDALIIDLRAQMIWHAQAAAIVDQFPAGAAAVERIAVARVRALGAGLKFIEAAVDRNVFSPDETTLRQAVERTTQTTVEWHLDMAFHTRFGTYP